MILKGARARGVLRNSEQNWGAKQAQRPWAKHEQEFLGVSVGDGDGGGVEAGMKS